MEAADNAARRGTTAPPLWFAPGRHGAKTPSAADLSSSQGHDDSTAPDSGPGAGLDNCRLYLLAALSSSGRARYVP